MSNAVILGGFIGAGLGIAGTAFVYWLANVLNPPPKPQDDTNPWFYEGMQQ